MTDARQDDPSENTLGDSATVTGKPKSVGVRDELSLGDELTYGDGLRSQDTVLDDSEVIDLAKRYTILGPLGQGGMGAVLLALDNRLGRKVAIKRILGEAAGDRTAVARFLTEARAIAALNHPNIVQIYECGRAHDGPFLILEYVDGGKLLERCKAGPILCELDNLARRYIESLADRLRGDLDELSEATVMVPPVEGAATSRVVSVTGGGNARPSITV